MQLPPDVALFVLRLLMVAIVYLFLMAMVLAVRRSADPRPSGTPAVARRLVVLESPPGGPAAGVAIALQSETTIGRAADNVVVIGDAAVSGRHARLSMRDGSWWAEDLGSTNGTWVNGQPLSAPVGVGVGDEIEVGPARLRLER